MGEEFDEIVEEREEIMVSLSGGNPIRRKALFLKPSIASIGGTVAELPPQAFSTLEHKTLAIDFLGWRFSLNDFDVWVQNLGSLHESTWRKAGIFDSIMASTCRIHRNSDLIRAIAEKWCIGTKTFVFSWGEATITLEDVMILLGYSVLGAPVSAPLENKELEEIKEKLERRRLELNKSMAKKPTQQSWMRTYMNSGDEIEHEAFLALWLSRFVFPFVRDVVSKDVFNIAIHLARGSRIALAPVVLASIYRDLSLLKNKIDNSENEKASDQNEGSSRITLPSPFQLVQVWVWERFPELRPKPNLIKHGEPRLRQWDEVRRKVERVSSVLDSAGLNFDWRPYTKPMKNWKLPKFYAEKERWLPVDRSLDDDIVSFARCLRSLELVGLDSVEQYLPNRVSQQFGFDQDLPGYVEQSNTTLEAAWSNYSRAICNAKLYIPSVHAKPCITQRYFEWWKKLVEAKGTERKSITKVELHRSHLKTAKYRKEPSSNLKANCEDIRAPGSDSGSSKEELPMSLEIQKQLDNSAIPPGLSSRYGGIKGRKSIEEDRMTIAEFIKAKSWIEDDQRCEPCQNVVCKKRKHAENDMNPLDQLQAEVSSKSMRGHDPIIAEIQRSSKKRDEPVTRNKKNLPDQSESLSSSAAFADRDIVMQTRKEKGKDPAENDTNPLDQLQGEVSSESMREGDPTIAEIQRSSKKRKEVVTRNNDNPPDQSESLSSSVANADRDIVLQARKGKGKDLVDEPVCVNGSEIRSSYSIEVPSLEMEARKKKLQKFLAELKSKMSGQ